MDAKKLEFIDSLRGLAALYVVLHHLTYAIGGLIKAPRWLEPLVFLGSSGVTLFFLVSAFTLCLSSDNRKNTELHPLKNYFTRRFFRIAPLFYLWVIIFSLRSKPDLAELVRSFLFVQNLFPGHEAGIVWASWTISLEMLFYLMFPMAFMMMKTLVKSLIIFALAVAIQAPWFYFVMANVIDSSVAKNYWQLSLPLHLSAFMGGIVAFHIYKRLSSFSSERQLRIGLLLVSTALLAFASLSYLSFVLPLGGGAMDWMPRNILLKLLLVSFYGSLLLGLAMNPIKVLVNRVTRFYGEISYSVYLSHVVVLILCKPVFSFIAGALENITLVFFLAFGFVMAIITPLSWVTFRIVEKKGNEMGRRLIRKVESRSQTALSR